jgi:hypothetical protein
MSTADQGVHVVPDAHHNANLDINNSLIKGKQSPFSGKPMGPAAVVVEGGQSSGSGNIISSHTGFQGKSFNSKIVPRPKSPFTGEVFIPLANGPQIDQGALAKIPYLVGNPLIEVAKPFELTFAIPSQPGQPVPTGRLILGVNASLDSQINNFEYDGFADFPSYPINAFGEYGTQIAQGYFDNNGKVTIKLPAMLAKKLSLVVYYEGDAVYAGNISKKTIAIGTPNQRIVQELYQEYLGRNADAAGLRQWTERIDSGIPLEQVVRELRISTEASQRVVQSAFNEILGRSAHTQGLNGWTRYIQNGHSRDELRAELIASREYQSTHSKSDSINSIYRTFIGRDASQAGIESWLKNWEAGMSLSQIIRKIENSRESREHIVDSLYQEILNRPADGIGLREWTDSLEQGIDEDALTAALLRSPEFAG